jgi:hypothetical protein
MMRSQEILEDLYQKISAADFDAPYGIVTGEHVNGKGQRYLSITFGRRRTLDATVEIYNQNFMILLASNRPRQRFWSVSDVKHVIDLL